MRHEAIAPPAAKRWAGLVERRFLALVVLAWALSALLMIALAWSAIGDRHYPDPDDQLRLVQVRDWIDGQAFRDVTQYRMNPPAGAPMHWSRLVDIPIAAPILALRPLLGYERAQTVAAIIVPMLLLLGLMLLVGTITRRVAGPVAGLVGAVATITTFGAVVQFIPLRVDHHNWQILLSIAATGAALMRPSWRSGAIAGAALATALQVSIEALPFAALYGAVIAGAWALFPGNGNRDRMWAFAASLFVVEAALTAALRADATGYCDAASTPHIAAFGVVAAGLALAGRFAPAARWRRFAALGLVAVPAAAVFRAIPPHCGVDAFSMLEPIVRANWYEHVMEGLPVWEQSGILVSTSLGYPIVSIICASFAIRGSRGAARGRWVILTALLLCGTAVAVLVERAAGLASLLAVPPAAWATVSLVSGVQHSRRAIVRVFGTVGVVLGLSPMAAGVIAVSIPALQDVDNKAQKGDRNCGAALALRGLDALPPGRMLAPMNVGPTILLQTRHSILTSGYHRNHVAIVDELNAFLGSDATARRIVDRHGLRYVEFCTDHSETDFYRGAAPHGFAAHLAAGRAPDWLRPLGRLPGGIGVWEVAR